MNYQLMFQTIATLCGVSAFAIWLVAFLSNRISERTRIKLLYTQVLLFVLFIITLITGALAAGLS